MQQLTDQSVGQRKDVPGQYLDIVLVPGQYLNIAQVAGLCKIYCSAIAFNPPTQSVILIIIQPSTKKIKLWLEFCHEWP